MGCNEFQIKAGYNSRRFPLYFDDAAADLTYQPDVYEIVGELARVAGVRTIVDLGCGNASKLLSLRPTFQTIGVDIGRNLEGCRKAEPACEWVSVDLEKQVIDDGQWASWAPAVIVCADVIEHLIDPSKLLESVLNGLNRGCLAVFSTPDRDLVRGEADMGPPANPHHVREWSAIEFARLMSSAGFRILRHGHTRNNDRDQKLTTITTIVSGVSVPEALRQGIVDPSVFSHIAVNVPVELLARRPLSEVTIVIKTFERPSCCARLVDSIRMFYPEVPVLVADDSAAPQEIAGARCYALPFDSGLAAGRNVLLEAVQTKYFVLCDDDFVFTPETKIEVFLNLLEQFGLDIVGGHLRLGSAIQTHHGLLDVKDGCLIKRPGNRGRYVSHEECDVVLNFFGAKTTSVRAIGGWDSRLKLCEHALFFLRAKDRLKVADTHLVLADHVQLQEDDYVQYRRRALQFFFRYCRDYGIERLIEMDGTEIVGPSL